MPCQILFNPIQTENDGLGNVTQITVSGTSQDCPVIRIRLFIEGLELFNEVINVVNGNWNHIHVVNPMISPVKCNVSYRLTAECLDDSGAVRCANEDLGQVPCEAPVNCPELSLPEVEISDDCGNDGTRRVEIVGASNAVAATIVTVAFGDGQFENIPVRAGLHIYRAEHAYRPGRYQITVFVAGCDQQQQVEINILPCAGQEPQCLIEFGEAEVQQEEDCRDGVREVDIAIPYTNSGANIVAALTYGDGTNEQVRLAGDGRLHVLQLEHRYATGRGYQLRIQLEDPCADYVLEIPPVSPCAPQCPRFGIPDIVLLHCPDEGHRLVRITFAYDADQDCRAELVFGNNLRFPVQIMQGQNRVLVTEVLLPTGVAFRPFIRLLCDGLNCADIPFELKTVLPCGDACPSYADAQISMGDCVNNRREVTVRVTISSGENRALTVNYGDGSAPERLEVEAGENNYTLRHRYATGLNPTIVISLPGCDDLRIPVGIVSRCGAAPAPDNPNNPGNGNNNGGGGDEGFGCMLLRWILVLGAGIALLSVLLATCIPPAAAALQLLAAITGGIGLVAGILWAIFCPKPCLWGLLLGWQAMLVAGTLSLYFFSCCPVLFWTGLASVGVSISLAFTWARNCGIGRCRLLGEFLAVLVGVALPLAANLANIPPVNACLSNIVAGIIGAIAALLAFAVVACQASRP